MEEDDIKNRKWDSREREMNRIHKLRSKRGLSPQPKTRKFDPRKRFKSMLVCLSVFLFSTLFLLWSLNVPGALFQEFFSMIGTLFRGHSWLSITARTQ